MSALPAASSTPLPQSHQTSSHRARVAFWPVFFWLALQALALFAAGMRVPFSARFAAPAEQMALHEMFVVQMVVSGLLFPVLFREFGTGTIVIASAALMTQLAGILAAEVDQLKLTFECGYSALWLIGLALWARALRTPKARMYGVAAVSLLVIGGTLAAYLEREFGAPLKTFDWPAHGWWGPLTGAMALAESGARVGSIWVFLGTFVASGGMASIWAGTRPRTTRSEP